MNEFEFDDILYTILKGIISGFLIAYLIILGLRPSAEYPDNIIEIIDNPWIFIVLILINFYAMQWDLTIGLLLLLSIIALLLDVIIFTEGEVFNSDINIEQFKEDVIDEEEIKDVIDEEENEEEKEEKTTDKKKEKTADKKKEKTADKKDDNSMDKLLNDEKFTNKVVSLVLSSIQKNLKDLTNE